MGHMIVGDDTPDHELLIGNVSLAERSTVDTIVEDYGLVSTCPIVGLALDGDILGVVGKARFNVWIVMTVENAGQIMDALTASAEAHDCLAALTFHRDQAQAQRLAHGATE